MNTQAEKRFDVDNVLRSIRNFASLSEALRVLGAAVLLASMSLFLLQGWDDGNDISRYLLLLAQTGLLTAAGFAMSHGLRETKGARIFFGLALVSVVANFTILGALLYSAFQWDGALTTYPGYAHWSIGDVANVGITMGGAMLVLVPVTLFCFAIMARHSAKILALNYLLLNLLLLLPLRSSLAAGSIALLGTLYALHLSRSLLARDRALQTGEGKFALSVLFVPLGIILFRSMYFYQIDSLMIVILSLAGFLLLRQASQFPNRKPGLAVVLEMLSLPIASVFALALTDVLELRPVRGFGAPMFSLFYTALALDVVRRTASKWLAGSTIVSVCALLCVCFVFGVAVNNSAGMALFSLSAGVVMLLASLVFKSRAALIGGLFTSFGAAVFGFEAVIEMLFSSSWIELALFGAMTIMLGSWLDKHGVAVKLRLNKWLTRE